MFKKGEVVYHDDLVFLDGVKDPKKDRPCIVLFELVVGTTNCVLTCPMTSQLKQFNKFPNKHMLVPCTVYNYHKFSFAQINRFILKPLSQTHSAGIFVEETFVDKIIEKLKESNTPEYEILKNYVLKNEEILFSKVKQKSKKVKSI